MPKKKNYFVHKTTVFHRIKYLYTKQPCFIAKNICPQNNRVSSPKCFVHKITVFHREIFLSTKPPCFIAKMFCPQNNRVLFHILIVYTKNTPRQRCIFSVLYAGLFLAWTCAWKTPKSVESVQGGKSAGLHACGGLGHMA